MKQYFFSMALVAAVLLVGAGCSNNESIESSSEPQAVSVEEVVQVDADISEEVVDAVVVNNAEPMSEELLSWFDDYNYDDSIYVTEIVSDHVAKNHTQVFYKYFERLEDRTELLEIRELKNVDAPSLVSVHEYYPRVIKDKENVYYSFGKDFKVLDGIDKHTIQDGKNSNIKNLVLSDATHYVFMTAGSEPEFIFADKNTFEKINGTYSKDKDFLYFNMRESVSAINYVDLETLEVIDERFIKDSDEVFGVMGHWEWITFEKLENADPDNFQVISRFITKDDTHVYNNTRLVTDFSIDARSLVKANDDFQTDGIFYDKDAMYIFASNSGIRIDEVDLETLDVIDADSRELGRIIWKDKNGVYIAVLDYTNEFYGIIDISVANLNADPETVNISGNVFCSTYLDIDNLKDTTKCIKYRDKNGTRLFRTDTYQIENGYIKTYKIIDEQD